MPGIRGVTRPVGVFPSGFLWGVVSGTTAGELLHVGYSGTTVVDAHLTLGDGRQLEFGVADGELTLLLPPDTPDGFATIVATLANGTTRQLVILLHGLAVPSSMPGRVGPARRGARAGRRTVESPSRIRLAAGTRVLAAPAPLRTTIVLRPGSRARELSRPRPATVVTPTRIAVVTGTRLGAFDVRSARLTMVSSTGAVRRDGREIEEALLLGLL